MASILKFPSPPISRDQTAAAETIYFKRMEAVTQQMTMARDAYLLHLTVMEDLKRLLEGVVSPQT